MVASSPRLPSNFGIYEGSFVGITGHMGSFRSGSLISWFKYGRLIPTTKGGKGVGVITLVEVQLMGVSWLVPGLPPSVPTPILVPHMMAI